MPGRNDFSNRTEIVKMKLRPFYLTQVSKTRFLSHWRIREMIVRCDGCKVPESLEGSIEKVAECKV